MNSNSSVSPSSEALRNLDIDHILAQRLQQDRLESRHQRIARIGRVWNHRKLLGKFSFWGLIVGLLAAFLIPVRYAAITRLMPPDPPQGQGMAILASLAGRVGANLGAIGSDLLGIKTSADLFAAVLQSRIVQDHLINKFDLREVYGERRFVDARKILSRRTDISIDRKSGVLAIQVVDHDPKRASELAQEYVGQLNNVVTQLNTSSAHRERVFLEQRLDQVKSELGTAEKDFSHFASKSGAIDIKEQGKAMVEAAAILEGQYIAAQTELQGLRQIYTDQNIRIRAAQARVNELHRQLMRMGGKPETGEPPSPLETASASNSGEELYPSIRKLPLLGVTYADLYRRMKVEETVFETLTQQYELAKVQEAKEVPSVKVLDPPEVPEKRIFPPRILLIVAGAVLALVLGVFWILATDNWEKIDPQDPGKILVLSMVHSVKPQFEYVVQTRNSLSTRTKRFFDRFQGESAPAETKQ